MHNNLHLPCKCKKMETEVLPPLQVTFTHDQTPELKGKSMMHLISHILYKKEAIFFQVTLIVFCSIPLFWPGMP